MTPALLASGGEGAGEGERADAPPFDSPSLLLLLLNTSKSTSRNCATNSCRQLMVSSF